MVGDITYLATGEGWLYLADVLDLATRSVLGYAGLPRSEGHFKLWQHASK